METQKGRCWATGCPLSHLLNAASTSKTGGGGCPPLQQHPRWTELFPLESDKNRPGLGPGDGSAGLPHKPDDLNLNPGTHTKSQMQWFTSVIPELQPWDGRWTQANHRRRDLISASRRGEWEVCPPTSTHAMARARQGVLSLHLPRTAVGPEALVTC